ncbi:hypothetical protein MAR_013062 [Mya arenaria]|uniref:Uncharacterized protein n=1 Tax=Mya arenaria TaxID=6604 RepID=A0ABY7FYS9_MYAAR|nr:uncharacterized protein LOC128220180 [Mya arenaria]XP_052784419.1 uncharacterized protein LOC128220180 [Mya arenaria]WAR27358.1 hypothetical protein MAR_013062 [Mya arenaria]
MFDSLIDNLNADKWLETDMAAKNDEWKEYHVMRHHRFVDNTTLVVMVAPEDGEARNVEVKDCQANKDPLKEIGSIELLLNAEETEVIGIDLNGDVVIRK